MKMSLPSLPKYVSNLPSMCYATRLNGFSWTKILSKQTRVGNSCLSTYEEVYFRRKFTFPKLRLVPGMRTRSLGLYYAALLSKDKKTGLLAGVSRDHVEIAARILDQAASAAKNWDVVHTDFLTPPAREELLVILARLDGVGVVVSGGYPQAERCRLSVGHPEVLAIGADEGGGYPGAVAAISVTGRFGSSPVRHGDFLGAVLGCGISRDKVGDILVQAGTGAQVLVAPEMVEYLLGSLSQVSNTTVSVESIPMAELQVKEPKVESVRTVEASLRVDAVASAGFRISRTKLGDLVSSGHVKVNWKEVGKSASVKSGDVVSVRGMGRLEIGEVEVTKKGRYSIQMLRFT